MKRGREEELYSKLQYFPQKLPRDVFAMIISLLDIRTFFQARTVCKQWKALIDFYLRRPNSAMDNGIWSMCHEFLKCRYIHSRPLIELKTRKCGCGLDLYAVHGLKWNFDAACMRPRCLLKSILFHYANICDCSFVSCKKGHYRVYCPSLSGSPGDD